MLVPQVFDDVTLRYVYGLGRIAQVGASDTFYYLTDGLGSTMALVDSAGTVVNTYDYDVFGAVRTSTGSQANEFKFTGEQADSSTGMEYLRARYYDMETGRFLSRDPLTMSPSFTGAAYAYVDSNPVIGTDPTGLAWGEGDQGAGRPPPKKKARPEPVPGPVAMTAEDDQICLDGFKDCLQNMAREVVQAYRDRNITVRFSAVNMACSYALAQCENRVLAGEKPEFRREDVWERVREMVYSRIELHVPRTGDGGLLNLQIEQPTTPQKEGNQFGCFRWSS